MAGFTNSHGLSLVSKTRDIVLMDGEHLLNTKFVSIELDDSEEKRWDNKSSRVEGRVIKYKVGDNLDDLDALTTQEKLAISLLDAETYEELDSLQDKKQNIIIKVNIIGGECPFDFLAVFTPDSQNRFFVDIQLICCILFVNMCLRNWFRTRGHANQIQMVQAYLLSLIDDLIIWDRVNYGITSNADLYSDKIRLISLVTLFVFTFFPARLGKGSAEILIRWSTIALRVGLQWLCDIDYNPAITLLFIAIPLLESSYNFKAERAIKYSKFLYLGTLLPHLITMALNLYQKRFFYVMPQPELHVIMLLVAFFLIAFVILPLQEQITQKIRRQARENYSVNVNSKDSCSICLEPLILVNSNNEELYDAVDQRSLRKLIKTKSGHMYHEKWMVKWLAIRLECCLCGAAILYIILSF